MCRKLMRSFLISKSYKNRLEWILMSIIFLLFSSTSFCTNVMAAGSDKCDGFTSTGNVYDCCPNGEHEDGNCTWWAWKMMSDRWGYQAASWGNAGTGWLAAAKQAGFTTGTPEDGAREGCIFVSSEGSGHVGYVFRIEENTVYSTEMNCSAAYPYQFTSETDDYKTRPVDDPDFLGFIYRQEPHIQYWYDAFDGLSLDSKKWNTDIATASKRWCTAAYPNHSSAIGNWVNVESETCYGHTGESPYGQVIVKNGLASFSSGYSDTFPYVWAGPPSRQTPFPESGDFILEVRMRFDSLGGCNGEGMIVFYNPNTDTSGNNPWIPEDGRVLQVWCDFSSGRLYLLGNYISKITNPSEFFTLKLKYLAGKFYVYLNGDLVGGPVASDLRPNTLAIGNAYFAYWKTCDWVGCTIDYIRTLGQGYIDDYPYRKKACSNCVEEPCGSDPWDFYIKNCTSYVAWRLNKALGEGNFSNYMDGGHWGNGSNWDDNVKNGFELTSKPQAGDVAQWNNVACYTENDKTVCYGHVAYVEKVNADGSILVSEYNWNNPCAYGQRTIAEGNPSHFIRPNLTPADTANYINLEDGDTVTTSTKLTENTELTPSGNIFVKIWNYIKGLIIGSENIQNTNENVTRDEQTSAATFLFSNPVTDVVAYIADFGGNTTFVAYDNDEVLKSVNITSSTPEFYTISNVGTITKVVVTSTSAWIGPVTSSTTFYVDSTGSCGSKKPCYKQISTAISMAGDGTVIKVCQGTYKEAPTKSTAGTVTISGGWNSDFSEKIGTTSMYAPGAIGGGVIRLQPNIKVIAP